MNTASYRRWSAWRNRIASSASVARSRSAGLAVVARASRVGLASTASSTAWTVSAGRNPQRCLAGQGRR